MQKLVIYLLLLSGVLASMQTTAQTINVMTFNIRYDEPRDLEDSWQNRKVEVVEMLKDKHPDFLGIQEGLHHQVAFLDSNLVKYSYIGVGRDDGNTQGEYSAIFFDTTRLNVVRSGTFWLSETPDMPSFGWDAVFHRVCTYGLFRYKEAGTEVWVLNTHFDHQAETARRNSAKLILQKLAELTGSGKAPVVLMGDFNATADQEPIQIITTRMTDALSICKTPLMGPKGTFNGFNPDGDIDRRIDYVFVDNVQVLKYLHLDDRRENGRHLSDHLAVMATLYLKP